MVLQAEGEALFISVVLQAEGEALFISVVLQAEGEALFISVVLQAESEALLVFVVLMEVGHYWDFAEDKDSLAGLTLNMLVHSCRQVRKENSNCYTSVCVCVELGAGGRRGRECGYLVGGRV